MCKLVHHRKEGKETQPVGIASMRQLLVQLFKCMHWIFNFMARTFKAMDGTVKPKPVTIQTPVVLSALGTIFRNELTFIFLVGSACIRFCITIYPFASFSGVTRFRTD